MKHLHVPYELALLAKEKGFDEYCFMVWSKWTGAYFNNEILLHEYRLIYFRNLSPYQYETHEKRNSELPYTFDCIAAPLYQQLVDWFREKHNIFIKIDNFLLEDNTVDYDYCICKCDADIDEKGNMRYLIDYDVNRSFTYYGALTQGIEEAFKLIS